MAPLNPDTTSKCCILKGKCKVNPWQLLQNQSCGLAVTGAKPAPSCTKIPQTWSFLHLQTLAVFILGKFHPTARQPPKSSCDGKTTHPNSEPFSAQQLQHSQGTARQGRDQSSCRQHRMMIIKETLNLALWGLPSVQQLVMPITHHSQGCCSQARHGFTSTKVLLGCSNMCISNSKNLHSFTLL